MLVLSKISSRIKWMTIQQGRNEMGASRRENLRAGARADKQIFVLRT